MCSLKRLKAECVTPVCGLVKRNPRKQSPNCLPDLYVSARIPSLVPAILKDIVVLSCDIPDVIKWLDSPREVAESSLSLPVLKIMMCVKGDREIVRQREERQREGRQREGRQRERPDREKVRQKNLASKELCLTSPHDLTSNYSVTKGSTPQLVFLCSLPFFQVTNMFLLAPRYSRLSAFILCS